PLFANQHPQFPPHTASQTSAVTLSRWLSSVSPHECRLGEPELTTRRAEFRPDPAYQKYAGAFSPSRPRSDDERRSPVGVLTLSRIYAEDPPPLLPLHPANRAHHLHVRGGHPRHRGIHRIPDRCEY